MPSQPVCPYCGAKLFPHELTNDACGTCGSRLSSATEWAPPQSEEKPPFPTGRTLTLPSRPPPEAFGAVRAGINLVYWGVALSLLFCLLGAAGQLAAESTKDRELQATAAQVGLFGTVFQCGSLLPTFVGVCFCCLVPKGCDARKWARCVAVSLVVAVTLTFLLVFVAVPTGVLAIGSPAPYAGQWWSLDARAIAVGSNSRSGTFWEDLLPVLRFIASVLAVIGLFGAFCYALLLAALARFFGDFALAKRLLLYSYISALICAFSLCGGGIAFEAQSGVPSTYSGVGIVSITDVVTCGGFMLGVVLSLWLLALLRRLRRVMPVPGEPARPREYGVGR